MSFMDKAKDLVDKIEDKIPDSVKDKIPESVKDKLGIDDEAEPTDATAAGTDPGALSDVAAATSSDAAEKAQAASAPGYTKESDGTDPLREDAEGAGRGSISDITKSP